MLRTYTVGVFCFCSISVRGREDGSDRKRVDNVGLANPASWAVSTLYQLQPCISNPSGQLLFYLNGSPGTAR